MIENSVVYKVCNKSIFDLSLSHGSFTMLGREAILVNQSLFMQLWALRQCLSSRSLCKVSE